MASIPAVGSQTVVEEHRGDVCSRADALSGDTPFISPAVGLLIGRNIVGM